MKNLPATLTHISMASIVSKKRVNLFLGTMALTLILFGVAASGRLGLAATPEDDWSGRPNPAVSFRAPRGVSPIFFTVKEDPDSDSRSEEHKALEDELKGLLKDLKRLEKMAEEKFWKEIVPLIKKEIERLKEKLREFRSKEGESEDSEPIET